DLLWHGLAALRGVSRREESGSGSCRGADIAAILPDVPVGGPVAARLAEPVVQVRVQDVAANQSRANPRRRWPGLGVPSVMLRLFLLSLLPSLIAALTLPAFGRSEAQPQRQPAPAATIVIKDTTFEKPKVEVKAGETVLWRNE